MATQREDLKRLPSCIGSHIVVDGFNFQRPEVTAYFLTHFHGDHTTGLNASFCAGTIYASEVTAALVTEVGLVDAKRVVALPLDVPCAVEGVEVTAFDANHCPGAVCLHFYNPRTGATAVHTGDFRAAPGVVNNPTLGKLLAKRPLDYLYLDTTYCAPRWRFPPQDEVLVSLRDIARREASEEPETLFLVGAYEVGKEKAIRAVAEGAGSRVDVSDAKARKLRLTSLWDDALFTCGEEPAYHGAPRPPAGACEWAHTTGEVGPTTGAVGSSLPRAHAAVAAPAADNTRDATSASALAARPDTPRVRVVPMFGGQADHESMARLLGSTNGSPHPSEARPWRRVVAFRATGWAFTSTQATEGYRPWVEHEGRTKVYSIPYSEHSSFDELRAFVERVRPRRLIPTVNAETAESAGRLVDLLAPVLDLSSDPTRMDYYLEHNTAPPPPALCGAGSLGAPAAASPATDAPAAERVGRLVQAVGDGQLGQFTYWTPEPLEEVAGCAQGQGGGAGAWATVDVAEQRRIEAHFEALRRDREAAARASQVLEPFPLKAVAYVHSHEGVAFRSRERLEAALRTLGARIVKRLPARSARAPEVAAGGDCTDETVGGGGDGAMGPAVTSYGLSTLVVVSGRHDAMRRLRTGAITAEAAAEVVDWRLRGARVVGESWVLRHVRAVSAGVAPTHSSEEIARAEEKMRAMRALDAKRKREEAKELRTAGANGVGWSPDATERRMRPWRSRTRAVDERIGRALSQRLFLIVRRDVSCGPGGAQGAAAYAAPAAADTASEAGGASRPTSAPAPQPGRELRADAPAPARAQPGWSSEFVVLGTTGLCYTCTVDARPRCTCKDESGHTCKHLLWVYLRVLRVGRASPLLQQRALLQSELAEMLGPTFGDRRWRASGDLLPAPEVRQAYADATGDAGAMAEGAMPAASGAATQQHRATLPAKRPRKPLSEEGCPICYEPFQVAMRVAERVAHAADARAAADGVEGGNRRRDAQMCEECAPALNAPCAEPAHANTSADGVEWCANGCGANVHADCMARWLAVGAARMAGALPSCPLCRTQWAMGLHAYPAGGGDDPAVAAAPWWMEDGVVHVGQLQPGTSTLRDTSTYNEWWHRRQRKAPGARAV